VVERLMRSLSIIILDEDSEPRLGAGLTAYPRGMKAVDPHPEGAATGWALLAKSGSPVSVITMLREQLLLITPDSRLFIYSRTLKELSLIHFGSWIL